MLHILQSYRERNGFFPTSDVIIEELDESVKADPMAWKLAALLAKHCWVFGMGDAETDSMVGRLLSVSVAGPPEDMIDPSFYDQAFDITYDQAPAPEMASDSHPASAYQTPAQQIAARAGQPMTGQVQYHLDSLEDFENFKEAYYAFSNGSCDLVPRDLDIRRDPQAQQECVKQLFDAILDMSNTIEAADGVMPTPGPSQMATGTAGRDSGGGAGMKPKNKRRIGDILGDHGLSKMQKIERLIGRPLSDLDIEFLCWEILEAAIRAQEGKPNVARWQTDLMRDRFETFEQRWASICEALRAHKLILQSLSQISWIERIAAAPQKEQTRKTANKKCNNTKTMQNKAGAAVIKAKTQSGQWMVDERLGITDAAGTTLFAGTVRGSRWLQDIMPGGHEPGSKRRKNTR
ncbi:hypothetical protein ACHAQH_009660 [Verticillium albo-atrum]